MPHWGPHCQGPYPPHPKTLSGFAPPLAPPLDRGSAAPDGSAEAGLPPTAPTAPPMHLPACAAHSAAGTSAPQLGQRRSGNSATGAPGYSGKPAKASRTGGDPASEAFHRGLSPD
eukprot:gene14059-biopygen7430